MCVTGVPVPRKDHALAMARFSRDAMYAFSQVIHDLEEVLGEGTNKLSLRVGIHSGDVTAGVIRGSNARFQLFGDVCTVNHGVVDLLLVCELILIPISCAVRLDRQRGFPNGVHWRGRLHSNISEHRKSSWLLGQEQMVHTQRGSR